MSQPDPMERGRSDGLTRRLRFVQPELEQAYLASRRRSPRASDLVALSLLPALALMGLAFDGALPLADHAQAILRTLEIAAFLLAASLVGWPRARHAGFWLPLLPHGVAAVSLATIALDLLGDGAGGLAVGLLMLHLLAIHALARLDWRQAGIVGLIVVLVLLLAGHRMALGAGLLIGPALLLSLAVLLTMAGRYRSEREDRRRWSRERLLEELCRRDPLTGLHNRRSFFEYGQHLMKRRPRPPLALLLVDVDHFKQFNDHHGHLEGDRSLCRLAGMMQAAASGAEDRVGRLGGEEFGLLLTGRLHGDTRDLARTLCRQIATSGPDDPAPITVSIGVAVLDPGEVRSWESLYIEADLALYRAKGRGRNNVV